ncbi:hypothetical protein P0Y35_15505 [Kiritimatiellaeota bacterium B1221]|nr:hypothetical protein [Kiritimatiellaeota bacterium B1221]
MKISFSAFLFFITLSRCMQAADLGPYQLILDKQLLGVEKTMPLEVSRAPVTVAAPSWSRDYRMTMITQDEDKLRVGLQSLKDQSSILLIEGEEAFPQNHFQLVSGDYMQGTAVIRYQGSESHFRIESGPAAQPASSPENSSGRGGRGSSTRISSPRNFQPSSVRPRAPVTVPTAQPQVREFKTREELQAHLEEQQMDAIRTGKPPLPIPLTPKMDSQLVNEGILPPQ